MANDEKPPIEHLDKLAEYYIRKGKELAAEKERSAVKFAPAKPAAPIRPQPTPVMAASSERAYTPSWTVNAERGKVNSRLICPHCQTRGMVHTHEVKKKVGISGGKATGALLTAGLSLFVTGLSRKERLTEAYCGDCESTWLI